MGQNSEMTSGRADWLKRCWPLVVLVAIGVLVVAMGWHKHLSLLSIAEHRDALRAMIAAHYVISLLIYVSVYAVVTALSVPGAVYLTLAGGFLFGWMVGGAAAVVGATIGATIIFLVAKTSLGEPLAARAGPWLAKLRRGFQEDALSYLLFLRLVPAFPFWLVNLAPALLGVRLSTYVFGTFIGIIPGAFAFAFAGAGLDSVIAAQRQSYEACLAAHPGETGECAFEVDPAALVTTELLIAFAALGALALVPVFVKKLRKKTSTA